MFPDILILIIPFAAFIAGAILTDNKSECNYTVGGLGGD